MAKTTPTKTTPTETAQPEAAANVEPVAATPTETAQPAPEAPPVDTRSASEILADPGRPLTYGEILDLEARAGVEAA
jgi:hypothetical protein